MSDSEAAGNGKSRGSVNPLLVGGAFLAYCQDQGWIVREGSGADARYFVTPEGEEPLREYGVRIARPGEGA